MSRSRKSSPVGAQVRLSLAIVGALAAGWASASERVPFAGGGDLHLRNGKARIGATPGPRASLVASTVSVTSCADDFGAGTCGRS